MVNVKKIATVLGIGALAIGAYKGIEYLVGTSKKPMEAGYINPSEIKLKTVDINENGAEETVVMYRDERFLLRYNSAERRPEFVRYAINLEPEKK